MRRRVPLGEFGIGKDSNPRSPTPLPQHPVHAVTSAPIPAATHNDFGRPLSKKNKFSTSTNKIPIRIDENFEPDQTSKLGEVLVRYVARLKQELMIADLTQAFMDDPEEFLTKAGAYYQRNDTQTFLSSYAKHYQFQMFLFEVETFLTQLTGLSQFAHPIEKVFALKDKIAAGANINSLLSQLPGSSANILAKFTEEFQALSAADETMVTDLIIDSLRKLDVNYLIGILSYASTTVATKRDEDGKPVEVIAKDGMPEPVTVVSVKFPPLAAEIIARLYNEKINPDAQHSPEPCYTKVMLPASSQKAQLISRSSQTSQKFTLTPIELTTATFFKPAKPVSKPNVKRESIPHLHPERILSLLGLGTEHAIPTRQPSRTNSIVKGF